MIIVKVHFNSKERVHLDLNPKPSFSQNIAGHFLPHQHLTLTNIFDVWRFDIHFINAQLNCRIKNTSSLSQFFSNNLIHRTNLSIKITFGECQESNLDLLSVKQTDHLCPKQPTCIL